MARFIIFLYNIPFSFFFSLVLPRYEGWIIILRYGKENQGVDLITRKIYDTSKELPKKKKHQGRKWAGSGERTAGDWDMKKDKDLIRKEINRFYWVGWWWCWWWLVIIELRQPRPTHTRTPLSIGIWLADQRKEREREREKTRRNGKRKNKMNSPPSCPYQTLHVSPRLHKWKRPSPDHPDRPRWWDHRHPERYTWNGGGVGIYPVRGRWIRHIRSSSCSSSTSIPKGYIACLHRRGPWLESMIPKI